MGPDEVRFFLLTSFQWLPRNGIATPAQIINAVQDGVYTVLALLVLKDVLKFCIQCRFQYGQ
jgi:hypothetical protein